MIESREVRIISSGEEDMQEILNEAEIFANSMKLSAKESLRVRLMTEETMAMIRQITGEPDVLVSFKGEDKICTIHLEIETVMDQAIRDNLLSISKSGKNAAAKGVLGKIRDVIEQFIYIPGGDMTDDFVIDYVALGAPIEYTSAMTNAMSWSLQNYRINVEAIRDNDEISQEAWDELEKSVVANLADDVNIGIKGKLVTIDVIKNFD